MCMDQALKQENIPSGGIADFIYTDEEIKLLEDKELQDLYGQNGIAQFKTIGKEMANFGRYGDDTIAHVETGELIVPRALIENNPKLKESIFGHLRELGVEDPERYVVGTSKNSLNPDTGLPEFFLKKLFKGAKKAVSSVAKGVSSALKGVGKALKRVAPIVVPLALNYFLPGLGAVYSGALGAGITTLLQGGDVKDALKSAFVGGATGAVTAGFSGKGSFGSNIATDVSTGTTNIGRAFTEGSLAPLRTTTLPSLQDLTSEDTAIDSDTLAAGEKPDFGVVKRPVSTVQSDTTPGNIPKLSGDPYAVRGPSELGGDIYPDLAASQKAYDANVMQGYGFPDAQGRFAEQDMSLRPGQKSTSFMEQFKASSPEFGFQTDKLPPKPQTMFDKASNFIFGPDDVTPLEILKKEYPDLTFDQLKGIDKDSAIYLDAVEKAANASPGFIRRFGPSAALGIAGLSAAGAFDVPEQESIIDETGISGFDLYRENPDKFRVADLDVRRRVDTPPERTRTSFDFNYNPYVLPTFPFQRVAEGGEIFPRRNGGISPREGTPGKDSVRAMLMPGEFVMTTDAVKGLGDGNLDKGIKNMYSVMSKLEKRGKAMA